MKRKDIMLKTAAAALSAVLFASAVFSFGARQVFLSAVAKSAFSFLPTAEDSEKNGSQSETIPDESGSAEKKEPEETEEPKSGEVSAEIYTTPEDIRAVIDEAKKKAASDKKDGGILEKQYINDGVTDSYKNVRIKNVNEAKISVEALLGSKADLSFSKAEPSVLIFHTHTTESYQMLDRDFYAVGFTSRSRDEKRNMLRVGDAICARLEKAGIKTVHDRKIHDLKYSGAYERSRESVVEILKKYPSIHVVLDVHRDAIEQTHGVKIKPTAKIGGRKAAQIMIISGCQEKGNGVSGFPDWKQNLIFASQLQKEAEDMFPGLTRPLFFCPRKYNMDLTHCSLLVEFGSDANTLDEAVYSGDCFARALAGLFSKYAEKGK